MLDTNLKLSVLEISLFFSGALILGISIRSFIASKLKPRTIKRKKRKSGLAHVEWELKYLSEMEMKEKEISKLKLRLKEARENEKIFSTEVEKLRQQQNKLEELREKLEQALINKDKVRQMVTGKKQGNLIRV